jgi:DNA-binding winged helix-turn-helix (wHTH) protein
MLYSQEPTSDMDLPDASFESPGDTRPTGTEAGAEECCMAFRRYTVFPAARVLLRNGDPISIGGRAFDLLVILLRSRGRVVTKQEITRYVWPDTFVEESNLRYQVGCLRRALGRDADLVKSIAGRGYLLAADHMPLTGRAPAPRLPVEPVPRDELLDGFLRSAGVLVSTYGSLEAFLGALAAHRR